MKCWVFDIDGTISDCSHRLHHIQKSPKDWGSFFGSVGEDALIAHVAVLARELWRGAWPVVFVSGRSDECRDATISWLRKHGLAPNLLYMRRAGDHRDDSIVKIELLKQLRNDGYEPIMVFDDRARVVDAWRSAGVPCAQVAVGDF